MTLQTRAVSLAILVVATTVAPHRGWGQEIGAMTLQERVSPDSLQALIVAAQLGDVVAQHDLGRMYANGEGVPENDAEAVRWLRAAAEQGHAAAQSYLGFMYHFGQGVP